MVRALPKTIKTKVRIEPSANVEIPVTPWPMVQPMDNTPPTPMSTPPMACARKSLKFTNHSIRKVRVISAYSSEPATQAGSTNAQVTQDPIPDSSSWAFNYEPYTYDPERARALLGEAGYPDGFEMEIMPTTFIEATVRAAQVIQADLAAVGIRADIRTLEWAEWLEEQGAGNYDTYVCSWNGLIDPDDFYYAQHRTGEVFNFTGYSNPSVDELLDQGRVIADPAERRPLYAEINRTIVDEAPYIYLYNPLQIHAYGPQVEGFQSRADQAVRFVRTWLNR